MKIFAVIFCLLLSANAWCQSSDTTRKTMSVYKLLQQIKTQPGTSDPLIMLNDSVYTGDMRLIQSSGIASIDVMTGNVAKRLYGLKAQNGAFLMKTRKYLETGPGNNPGIINLPPKPIDTTQNDTAFGGSRYALGATMRSINEFDAKKTFYIVDGIHIDGVSDFSVDRLNPNNIISISVLKNAPNTDKHISDSDKVTVIIITKPFAIGQYQEKFSTFSKPYKDYLDNHQGSDEDCGYQLDGTFIYGKSNEDIRKLYDISDKKIKKVKFLENPFYNSGESKKMLALITTKK